VTANERRAEIVRILTGRRFETMLNLAVQFNVSRITIFNDIEMLTLDHPIETVRGRGGGVRFMKDYRNTYRNDITQEQQELLISLMSMVDKHGKKLLKELLYVHGSIRLKGFVEGGASS